MTETVAQSKQSPRPWVIFDADNTLWDVESLYIYARHRFAEKLKNYLKLDDDLDTIKAHQRSVDKNLGEVFGYDASRFSRSFEKTVLDYLRVDDVVDLPDEHTDFLKDVRDIAKNVFEWRAPLFQDSVYAIEEAEHFGYFVAIFTAGEHWGQKRRLGQSGLDKLCTDVAIEKDKTIDNLQEFLTKNNVDRGKSYFIGDSYRSDVAVAQAAGLNTIRVANPNWEEREHHHAEPDHEVNRLTEAVEKLPKQPELMHPKYDVQYVRAIFEGGGAKGIAHVGAVKWLRDHGFSIDRAAGSSAGALIAGLVAAGCEPDDILKPSEKNEIEKDSFLKADVTGKIGRNDWQRIRWFRRILAMPPRDVRKLLLAGGVALAFFIWIWIAASPWLGFYVLGLGALTVWIGRSIWNWSNLRHFGFASLDSFAQWYNELLLNSPFFRDDTDLEWVRFKDFPKKGAAAPVIIASDLSSQKLLALTYTESELAELPPAERREREAINRMPVAEAVAASASLPIVFQPRVPWPNAERRYLVDGGMLSNLPAWSVADGRDRRDNRLPILAFSLTEKKNEDTAPSGFFGYLRQLIKTSVTGVRSLETRGIEGLHVVDIPTSADVTGFDMNDAAKISTYREGLEAVKHELGNVSSPAAWKLVPESKMSGVLETAYWRCRRILENEAGDILRQQLPHARQSHTNPLEIPHLRVNIMWVTTLGTLRIAYRFGMYGDTDDDLVLPGDAGGAGNALETDATTIVDMNAAKYSYARYRMTKYEQALVRPTLQTLVSVPLTFKDGANHQIAPLRAVLNVDSDDYLFKAFKRDPVKHELERVAFSVLREWSHMVGDHEREGSAGHDGE